jgi:hypothetical protein
MMAKVTVMVAAALNFIRGLPLSQLTILALASFQYCPAPWLLQFGVV